MSESNAFSADNQDLEWSLKHIFNKQQAYEFVQEFQTLFCVYSPSVSQIYANYEFCYNGQETLLVLPNQFAYHDTFHRISDMAACKTRMQIIPGSVINKKGNQLLLKGCPEQGKTQILSLVDALKCIFYHIQKQMGALPVLINGDLREFKSTNPLLNLHMIRTDKLEQLSKFEINDVRQTVLDRIDNFIHHHARHSALKTSQVLV